MEPRTDVPTTWQAELATRLQPDEVVLGWFEPDLDQHLRFARQFVALTNQRIIGFGQFGADGQAGWRDFPIRGEVRGRLNEAGAIADLELTNARERLADWRFTLAQLPAARLLMQQWESERTGIPPTAAVCPSCGGAIPAGQARCPACSSVTERQSISSLFRLLQFAKRRAGVIAVGFCLTLASTTASLVPPYLTMPLLDDVLIPRQNGIDVPFRLVYFLLAGLFVAAMLTWLLDWSRAYVSAWVSERISSDLRQRTYAHLQRLSLEFFGGKRTGDLMSRISSDTDRLCTFLSSHMVDFITDVLMIAMTAIVLFTINPYLALATLLPFPIIVFLVTWARRRLLKGYHQSSIAWADMISVLADTIPGIRVVKAFAQEAREIDRFRDSNQQVLNTNDRVNYTWSFFSPIVTLLTTMGLLIVWGYAAYQVFQEQITVGVLTAFLAYITRFYTRSESMIRIFSHTQRAAASAHRIFEILDRVPSVPEPEKPVAPGRLEGRIELRGLRFKYGSREVLHGIDLTIQPGEMIGLVGHSGAGKTTLLNLICRFFDPSDGAILVDGVDIRSFPVEDYRKNLGLVLQDPFLFYGTVSENIAYGRPDAPRDEVLHAARAARAHDFILRLTDGYDSLVGERGQSLSGGERQRVSIARALLTNPRILILDEATSSVDTQTEMQIQAALEELTRGRTTIAIAHRLSTLRRADRIVVLDHGRIVEVGTHQELLDRGGKYAELHKAQNSMAQAETAA